MCSDFCDRRQDRPEAGLLGKCCAWGLQHSTRAGRSPAGVRSTLTAGGSNAAHSRRPAADSGWVHPFLLCVSEYVQTGKEAAPSWTNGPTAE